MASETPALRGLQLVAFRDVLDNVVQEAHAGVQQLAERLPGLDDQERKRELLQHLQTTRQRLQRLHVCAQWAHKAKAVNTCREVLKASQDHGAAFVHAADELFRLNEELRFCRAPLFDVSSALHIMQTGNYRLLPSVIEAELQQPGQRLERPGEADERQRAEQQRDAVRRVDFLLRSKLLKAELPAGMRVVRVRGGQAWVAGTRGQYEAQLVLVPAPRDDVVLAKYRPPGGADEAAGAKEEPEVAQPEAAATAGGQPSVSAGAGQRAASSGGLAAAAGEQQRQGEGWRWQLRSFELLPSAGLDPPPLQPQQRQWLQQHIEQRMWGAGDVEQLARLGRQAWVAVPPSGAAAKEQQGKAASAPAPSSSLAPSEAGHSKAEPTSGPQLAGEQEQKGEAGRQLPPSAGSALAVLHAVLCQTAGRLALFGSLLPDAKQLEGGSWKGGLKLSRAASGSGVRLAYWQQVAVASYAETECLQSGQPYQPPAGQQQQQQQQQPEPPAVEVSLRGDGTLAAAPSPALRNPLSGEPVQLHLPLDSPGSLSADRLLLQAAACCAATQLAAVQAVLQRNARLGQAGIYSELLLLGAAGVPAHEAGGGELPASPLLQLWCGGSLQLSLGMQLRSGRLLLSVGPPLLESEQGPAAAAAVSAAQLQLDATQRNALSQPLPAGTSRGMLAATLAAEALGRLSLQLAVRQRMDAAAADAAAVGLRRTTLPHRLLQQHLEEVAVLVEPLSSDTLTLALPAFPAPTDLLRRARQQQRRRQAGGGAPGPLDCGATRCFLLLDFGEAAAAGSNGGAAALAPGAPRVLLATCACTSRGTATRVLQLAEVPSQLLPPSQPATPSGRKRRASGGGGAGAAHAVGGGGGAHGLDLAALAPWCRGQAAWAALRSQMLLLPVQYAEELTLGGKQQRAIRLPRSPVLAELDGWAAAQLAGEGGGAPTACKPVATLRLAEDGGEAGGWRVQIASAYFARLPALLAAQGVTLAPPAPDATHMAADGSGLTARYALAKGHSVLTAVTDMVRVSMLHLCLTRLAGCMAANPLAAAAVAAAAQPPPAGGPAGTNGGLAAAAGSDWLPSLGSIDFLAEGSSLDWLSAPRDKAEPAGGGNGALANGQATHGGGGGQPADAGLVWPLPGCGAVRLLQAGLTHLLLEVAPPPRPEGLPPGGAAPPPLRATVSWLGEAGEAEAAADAGDSPGGGGGGGGGGLMRHLRCRVASEPALPAPVALALGAQLEAGRADLFLDGLCIAAHSAAAAAAQLSPAAQRAAGLLPGALALLGPGDGGASSALRLRARLQRGERALTLCLGFHAAGYTLLQLQPAQAHAVLASGSAWLAQLWQRLAQRVPTFAPLDAGGPPPAASDGSLGRHVRQAWVHRDGLPAALEEVMCAVGAPPDGAA